MSGFQSGDRIKVVFVDGNLTEGNVVTKYGHFDKEDDHYFYMYPDDEDIIRIGHAFIIKIHPLEARPK